MPSSIQEESVNYPFEDQDQSLVNLNRAVEAILRQYLVGEDIHIRFDLPVDQTPEPGTVCAFLYKVHENLEMRSSLTPQYNIATGSMRRTSVYLRYAYLITHWAAVEGEPNGQSNADGMAMTMNNCIVNALINNRNLQSTDAHSQQFRDAVTEVIPPEEGLNSLGNFWQSLDNQPRLVLGYAVTLRVPLMDPTERLAPVTGTQLGMGDKPAADVPRAAAGVLYEHLLDALQANAPLDEFSRTQLAGLVFDCQLQAATSAEPQCPVTVRVRGTLLKALHDQVVVQLSGWHDAPSLGTVAGKPLLIVELDHEGLIAYESDAAPTGKARSKRP